MTGGLGGYGSTSGGSTMGGTSSLGRGMDRSPMDWEAQLEDTAALPAALPWAEDMDRPREAPQWEEAPRWEDTDLQAWDPPTDPQAWDPPTELAVRRRV